MSKTSSPSIAAVPLLAGGLVSAAGGGARTAEACRPDAEVAGHYAPIHVQFDTASTVDKPEDRKRIADMARIAKASKIQQICVKGFADKQGDAALNRTRSEARAAAVADELARNRPCPALCAGRFFSRRAATAL